VLNEGNLAPADLPGRLSSESFCDLIRLVDDGTVAANTGKQVLAEAIATGQLPREIIERKGLRQISDATELETVVARILRDNPKAVADLREGKKQAQGFLMGQVMKATKGKANPKAVADLIARKLPEAP
jgi:aspartyl-tRNA(Asn)/glutamyl-tRNA(Gln) amidotransferase subunit B